MREIEFRGRTAKGEWVYGYHAKFRNYKNEVYSAIIPKDEETDEGYMDDLHPVIPETVGQYVGIKDKNRKKIFEGDILVFCKGATYPYQIEWDGMGWKLYRSDGKRIKEAFECNEIHYVNISEVIGNIHDNPELLEVEVCRM